MKSIATLIAFLLASAQITLAAEAGRDAAIKALQKALHNVNWDPKSAVVADVTCDRVADTVVVAYEREAVWLGTVPGLKANKPGKLTTMRFPVGTQSQDPFCAVPVQSFSRRLALLTVPSSHRLPARNAVGWRVSAHAGL